MKILSIGNSFSQDAQRYLHKLAKKEGENFKTVNLFIGGCSLETHYINSLDDNMAYSFEYNGEDTGLLTSIKQALVSDEWDVVTLQQVSLFSPRIETYFPYIESLAEYVKRYCPHAKIYIHQTWAYEEGSEKLTSVAGYLTATDMFEDIRKAYQLASEKINAYGIIPSGQAMFNATKMGIGKIHRDTFHASFGAGRYLLALTWFKTLTGKNITNNDFNDFDESVTPKERAIIIKAVNDCI